MCQSCREEVWRGYLIESDRDLEMGKNFLLPYLISLPLGLIRTQAHSDSGSTDSPIPSAAYRNHNEHELRPLAHELDYRHAVALAGGLMGDQEQAQGNDI